MSGPVSNPARRSSQAIASASCPTVIARALSADAAMAKGRRATPLPLRVYRVARSAIHLLEGVATTTFLFPLISPAARRASGQRARRAGALARRHSRRVPGRHDDRRHWFAAVQKFALAADRRRPRPRAADGDPLLRADRRAFERTGVRRRRLVYRIVLAPDRRAGARGRAACVATARGARFAQARTRAECRGRYSDGFGDSACRDGT